MKRLIKLLIKEEAKQVGTLYHYTNLDNLIKILNQDILKSNSDNGGYISFTRNKNFVKISRFLSGGSVDCALIINGDKLSDNYKIKPYHDQEYFNKTEKDFGSEEMELEEQIKGDISPIKPYIINIIILNDKINAYDINEFIENNDTNIEPNLESIKFYIQNTYGITVNIE